ncbi:MAG: hypothetical protein RL431_358 [Actinomycetota bacterium]|jgi:hypothetical protein
MTANEDAMNPETPVEPTQSASTVEAVETVEPTGRPGIVVRSALMVFFGAFYAFLMWQGVGNLVNIPAYFLDRYGIDSANVPWAVLIAGVAIPVLAYIAAAVVGWRQSASMMSLVFTTGFAFSALASINLLAIEKQIEVQIVLDFFVSQ